MSPMEMVDALTEARTILASVGFALNPAGLPEERLESPAVIARIYLRGADDCLRRAVEEVQTRMVDGRR